MTRDEAERSYDAALAALRVADTRAEMTLRKMRAGEVSPEEHEKSKAARRAASAEVSAARQRLRSMLKSPHQARTEGAQLTR